MNGSDALKKALKFDERQWGNFLALLDIFGDWRASEDFLESARRLVDFTQRAWLRPAGSERWELPERAGLEPHKAEIFNLLDSLGFVAEINPPKKSYDHVLILSARAAAFRKRINYFFNALENFEFKRIWLVGGSRKLFAGAEDDFIAQLGPDATETDMLMAVYRNAQNEFSRHNNPPPILVDTPLRDPEVSLRPNTHDTIVEWVNRHHPQPGSILVVMNQPFIHYQRAIVRSVVGQNFSVDMSGPAGAEDEKISVILDSLARYIYAELHLI